MQKASQLFHIILLDDEDEFVIVIVALAGFLQDFTPR